MGALSDWKTTVPGLIIAIGVTVALLMGTITFDQFQTFAGGLLSGALMGMNTKKG